MLPDFSHPQPDRPHATAGKSVTLFLKRPLLCLVAPVTSKLQTQLGGCRLVGKGSGFLPRAELGCGWIRSPEGKPSQFPHSKLDLCGLDCSFAAHQFGVIYGHPLYANCLFVSGVLRDSFLIFPHCLPRYG